MRAQTQLSRLWKLAVAASLRVAIGGSLFALGCTPRSIISSPQAAESDRGEAPLTERAASAGVVSRPEDDGVRLKAPTPAAKTAGPTVPGDYPVGAKVWELDEAKILASTVDEVSGYELILVQTAKLEQVEEDDDLRRMVALLMRAADADVAFEVTRSDVHAWADDYSLHFVRLTPELYDLRVNTHQGEDNWFTEVEAAVWRLPAGGGKIEKIWEGSENYSGVLDICSSADGVDYVVEGEVVRRVMFTEQSYTLSEPGDSDRVDRFECPPEPRVEKSFALWPPAGAPKP